MMPLNSIKVVTRLKIYLFLYYIDEDAAFDSCHWWQQCKTAENAIRGRFAGLCRLGVPLCSMDGPGIALARSLRGGAEA